jgi:hypothetical protein
VRVSVERIEQMASTTDAGTSFDGLIRAAAALGFPTVRFSTANPSPGTIMNPGGFSADVPASQFPAYLAASQGGCLLLPNPAPPAPTPPPEEDDPMSLGQFIARTRPPAGSTTPGTGIFLGNGVTFRHVLSPAEETDVGPVGAFFNGGKPVPMWPGCANGDPVADLAIFGSPENQETAEILDPAYGSQITYP